MYFYCECNPVQIMFYSHQVYEKPLRLHFYTLVGVLKVLDNQLVVKYTYLGCYICSVLVGKIEYQVLRSTKKCKNEAIYQCHT